jgi:hypothetical protein
MSNSFVCQLCLKIFRRIDLHLRIHNISSSEYAELFPLDRFSKAVNEKTVKKLPRPHGNTGRVAWNKGRKATEEERRKIKEAHWARKSPEETLEIRKKMSINGSNTMKKINEDGRAFRMPKGYHTEEHKARMKEIMTNRICSWSEEIKKNHWTKKTTEEVQEIINKIQQNGTKTNTKRGWFFSSKMNCEFYFMSSYEEERMKYLDECSSILSFTNQHKIWIDYEWNGDVHRYNPDLMIVFNDGRIRLEEIKGAILERDKIRVDAKEKACLTFVEKMGWEYKMLFKNDLRTI